MKWSFTRVHVHFLSVGDGADWRHHFLISLLVKLCIELETGHHPYHLSCYRHHHHHITPFQSLIHHITSRNYITAQHQTGKRPLLEWMARRTYSLSIICYFDMLSDAPKWTKFDWKTSFTLTRPTQPLLIYIIRLLLKRLHSYLVGECKCSFLWFLLIFY